MTPVRKRPSFSKSIGALMAGVLTCASALPGIAGTPKKWEQVPKAVRDTVLANGGKVGPVDLEGETNDGKAIYEAEVMDKDGKQKDLVITEDGKLVETKTDGAADDAAERKARGEKIIAAAKFSHPTAITNPFLPLSDLKQDVLEGTEAGKKTHVERTVRRDLHKTFQFGGLTIESLAVEDRVVVDGMLEEVAIDYFAQDDNGNVYYLGEEVDEYKDGKILNHEGTWLLGKDTTVPGLFFPGEPKIGAKYRPEDVSKDIGETDEVISLNETVVTPAGTFKDCVKIRETLADGKTEYKYYAKGVGIVRETPHDGDELMISHARTDAK